MCVCLFNMSENFIRNRAQFDGTAKITKFKNNITMETSERVAMRYKNICTHIRKRTKRKWNNFKRFYALHYWFWQWSQFQIFIYFSCTQLAFHCIVLWMYKCAIRVKSALPSLNSRIIYALLIPSKRQKVGMREREREKIARAIKAILLKKMHRITEHITYFVKE